MAKILIVDDALIMRNILHATLEKAGHEIVGTAANGLEALTMYGKLNPDLVTMDIQMAGGDGVTFLKEVIRMDPQAKVIMISALGNEEKEREMRSLGAVGFVSKPFQAEDLLRQTRKALAE